MSGGGFIYCDRVFELATVMEWRTISISGDVHWGGFAQVQAKGSALDWAEDPSGHGQMIFSGIGYPPPTSVLTKYIIQKAKWDRDFSETREGALVAPDRSSNGELLQAARNFGEVEVDGDQLVGRLIREEEGGAVSEHEKAFAALTPAELPPLVDPAREGSGVCAIL